MSNIAPWRSAIARGLHHNRSLVYSRYFQLATVKENGRPANRTVVFRGFLEDSNQVKLITDGRSDKINHIKQQPWAEICWYFPNTREQFRLSGCLKIVGSEDNNSLLQQARMKTWQELSDGARLQFAWPHPGKPRIDQPAAFDPPAPDPTQPVGNFCLLLLEPVEVEHLQLRGEPQNRRIYRLDAQQNWLVEELNP